MLRLRPLLIMLCTVAFVQAAPCGADDQMSGLIVFNDNGAWSWFEGERVIVDEASRCILLSSVANTAGAGGEARAGDVELVSYNFEDGSLRKATLHKHLQEDDHNSAALLRIPDGRYLASYSKHARDTAVRYKLSSLPGQTTDWQSEQIFQAAGAVTYSNLYYLAKTDTVFNFYRDNARGFDPNYLIWPLLGSTRFHYGGRLLTGPEGNDGNRDRPYLRYATNGVDRIHFLVTDHHPRDLISNSVYHGYIAVESGGYGLYRSDGTRVSSLSTGTTSPVKASNFTVVFAGDRILPANKLRMTRGWSTDIEMDDGGNPYAVLTARVNDSDRDHRFFYARFDGGAWQLCELAKAGGFLYKRENDYTGLAALDPNDPNRVFISTPIDPRTQKTLEHYEIFEGLTGDGGHTWKWSSVTSNSTVDNLRPIVPRGLMSGIALLWMRGKYESYTKYDTEIVGFVRTDPERSVARQTEVFP